MADTTTVWNFAYGSNMHPTKVRARAGFAPRSVRAATLQDWRLAFNLATGISWAEPSMANVVPEPGHTMHGVALEMSAAQFRALRRSEGGGRFYRCVDVSVTTYDGTVLAAKVFVAQPGTVCEETPPSLRYMTLIREGASHHGLEPDYCAWLNRHPTAQPGAFAWFIPLFFGVLQHPLARPIRALYLWVAEHFARRSSRNTRTH